MFMPLSRRYFAYFLINVVLPEPKKPVIKSILTIANFPLLSHCNITALDFSAYPAHLI